MGKIISIEEYKRRAKRLDDLVDEGARELCDSGLDKEKEAKMFKVRKRKVRKENKRPNFFFS